MRRGSASRARSPRSGRSAARDHGRRATPATSGPASSARSVPSAAWPRVWSCPSPTPGPSAGLLCNRLPGSDERPPRRDLPHRRVRRPCRARARRRGLAWRTRAGRAGQRLSPHPPAVQPGAEPGRERLAVLRANRLAISVFDDYDTIVSACCRACNRFADRPETVSSITSRQWAQVNARGRWDERQTLKRNPRRGFPKL